MASFLDRPLPSWSRWLVLGFVAWLAAAGWAGWYRWNGTQDNLNRLLDQLGMESPTLRQRITWERNPDYAKLDVARAIVHEAQDQRSLQGMSPEELAAAIDTRLERLPVARRLAVDVLEHHPASWEAPLFIGASTYLEWALSQDTRLFSEAARWQEPLLQAYHAAPAKAEPRVFLLAAYLELWPALSDERRASALEMLRSSFADDEQAWSRLGDLWLDRARDVEEAFSVLPEKPGVWSRLEEAYARKKEWKAYLAARERRLEASRTEVRRLVDLARHQRDLGDEEESIRSLSAALVLLPVETASVPLFEEAILEQPSGFRDRKVIERLTEWTRWAVDLHDVARPALSPEVFNRIATTAPSAPLPERALAALVADELYRGEHIEKRAETLALAEWAPYLVAKARDLMGRNELDAAQEALDTVVRHARDEPTYWMMRRDLAQARGDLDEQGRAEEEIRRLARREWTTVDWTWPSDGECQLRVLPAGSASGFRIQLRSVPEGGAVAQVAVDGEALWTGAVRPGQTLRVDVAVDAEVHLVTLKTLAGAGRVVPDATRLVGAAHPGAS